MPQILTMGERNKLQIRMIVGLENRARACIKFRTSHPTHTELCEAWFASRAFVDFNQEYLVLAPTEVESVREVQSSGNTIPIAA